MWYALYDVPVLQYKLDKYSFATLWYGTVFLYRMYCFGSQWNNVFHTHTHCLLPFINTAHCPVECRAFGYLYLSTDCRKASMAPIFATSLHRVIIVIIIVSSSNLSSSSIIIVICRLHPVIIVIVIIIITILERHQNMVEILVHYNCSRRCLSFR